MAEKEDTKMDKEQLIAMHKGNFYFREEDYTSALREYKKAGDKEKLVKLGKRCLKLTGQPKIAAEAFEAAGEEVEWEELIECGRKCLEWGRIHDGVFAYQWARRRSLLDHHEFVRKYLETDLFRKCGDAIVERAKRNLARKDEILEDAALAYTIAGRADKIAGIADFYFKEAGMVDNAKKADVFYERAALLALMPEENFDTVKPRILFPPTEEQNKKPDGSLLSSGASTDTKNTSQEEFELNVAFTPGSMKIPPEGYWNPKPSGPFKS